MEILISFFVMALWLGMVLMSRLITTTVHELGHAIPALLFTNQEVVIHIGSYGETKGSFLVAIGRLRSYFKFNLVQLNMGLCVHQNIPNVFKTMMITLGGPFNSLLFALILTAVMLTNDFSDGTMTLMALFVMSAVWDFFINLIPTEQPTFLQNGRVCYNDGQQFIALIQEMRYPDQYFEGLEYQYEGKHLLAVQSFNIALQEKKVYRKTYQALAKSYVAMKDYEMALQAYEDLHDKFGLTIMDYADVAKIYFEKKEYQEAIESYHHALYGDYKNHQWLYHRGCAYQELSEHEWALKDFDSAIYYYPHFAQAYNHRGFSKIRLGDLEGALKDIEQAKVLNPNDPYIYLHLGFYYQKKNNRLLALENFQKAKEMNINHYGIDYYIHEVS